jgi:uncharacterized protein (TIGR01777 family)
MDILVTGSTGLIGSKLCSFLTADRHHVLRMVRKARTGADEVSWDPSSGKLDSGALEGIDTVIHLAGENIAGGRWTAKRKRRIRESRINGTHLLAQSLAHLSNPPKILISVSAVGYYGDRGEEQLVEESSPGTGFLPDLCREWEEATEPASRKGIRVVIPRLGTVLSPKGGALALMLPIFRLGIGGRIGSGRQYMSWIAMDDLIGVFHHAIHCESLRGPVNAVSPNPVTNLVFSKTLGHVLSRPVLFALPSLAARIVFGEMADEALLASAKVSAARLMDSGYQFRFPGLEDALRSAFQKPASGV